MMAAAADDVQLVTLPQSEEHLTPSSPKHGWEDERSAETGRSPVSWDGPGDAENPMNWPAWLKVTNIVLVSFLTFVTALASSMVAPGVPEAMRDFDSDSDLIADFIVSVYVLGFAVGPMFLGPLSELYGRLPVYHVSNLGFIVFTVLCAVSSSIGMLTACRFFQGVFGAAPVTNGTLRFNNVSPSRRPRLTMTVQVGERSRTSSPKRSAAARLRSTPWRLCSAPSSVRLQEAFLWLPRAGAGCSGCSPWSAGP